MTMRDQWSSSVEKSANTGLEFGGTVAIRFKCSSCGGVVETDRTVRAPNFEVGGEDDGDGGDEPCPGCGTNFEILVDQGVGGWVGQVFRDAMRPGSKSLPYEFKVISTPDDP
jgi:hypothetical protein